MAERWNGSDRRWLAVLGAGLVLALGACGTIQGVGQDIQDASAGTRTALFGSDPDRPPID